MSAYLNLIPMQYRRRQMIRSILKKWAMIYSVAAVALLAAGWWAWNQNSEQRIALNAAQHQYTPLQKLEEESVGLKTETDAMQKRERLVMELSQTRSMLTLLGQFSIAAKNCRGKVNINSLSLTTAQTADQYSKISINGVGVNDVAIAQFVAELRDSKMFDNVQLTSSDTSQVGQKVSKAYSLVCTF